MMRYALSLSWGLSLLAATAACIAAPRMPPTVPPGTTPAAWITHDIDLDLRGLPHGYSCNALWYKFRDVLLAIGARPYMEITPYHCPPNDKGASGRSPTVHLRFQTLSPTGAAEAQWADVNAVTRTVELGPGHPASLNAQDCGLLQQIESTLFSSLNLKMQSGNLSCPRPLKGTAFELTVQSLQPPSGHG